MNVYTGLDQAWTLVSSNEPKPTNTFATIAGQQSLGTPNQYYCADLSVWSTNQNPFFYMTASQIANGLLVIPTLSTTSFEIDNSINKPYLQYVNCMLHKPNQNQIKSKFKANYLNQQIIMCRWTIQPIVLTVHIFVIALQESQVDHITFHTPYQLQAH